MKNSIKSSSSILISHYTMRQCLSHDFKNQHLIPHCTMTC